MTSHKLFSSILLVCLVGSMVALPTAAPANEKLAKLVAANDDFGLALLHRLELDEQLARKAQPENVFISPFSIGTVLGMLLVGSSNQTYDQIHQTLGFDKEHFSESEIFSNYKQLFNELKNKLSGTDKKNELQVANSMAVQKDFAIKESFLQSITSNFDSRVFSEDFAGQSHQATVDINKWVAEKTNGKIEKLFDQDLDASTVLVLLNAIYFKGEWKTKFEAKKTANVAFKAANDQTAQVPTMNVEHKFKLAQFDDGQLLELPYNDESLSMLVFLPNVNSVKQYKTISGLLGKSTTRGAQQLSTRLAQLHNRKVNVYIPKFKVEQKYSLKSSLTQLGVSNAFVYNIADLSRIDGRRDLYVSDVLHKTFIEVNEEGSEAAAVTGGVVVVESVEIVEEFNANRPFLFMIRDNLHQLTLFAGVINKP